MLRWWLGQDWRGLRVQSLRLESGLLWVGGPRSWGSWLGLAHGSLLDVTPQCAPLCPPEGPTSPGPALHTPTGSASMQSLFGKDIKVYRDISGKASSPGEESPYPVEAHLSQTVPLHSGTW